MKKLKLFLVDDHQILLDGIKAVLMDEELFEIIGEATRCSLALDSIDKNQPDIIITDIQMPIGGKRYSFIKMMCNRAEGRVEIINRI